MSTTRTLAPHSIFLPPLKDALQSFAMQMVPTLVRSAAEIESAIAALGREPTAGLLAIPDGYTYVHRALVTAQAAKHRVPAVYPFSVFATSGGLVSYGVEITDQYRRATSYVDRILRGAKPGGAVPKGRWCPAASSSQLHIAYGRADTRGLELHITQRSGLTELGAA